MTLAALESGIKHVLRNPNLSAWRVVWIWSAVFLSRLKHVSFPGGRCLSSACLDCSTKPEVEVVEWRLPLLTAMSGSRMHRPWKSQRESPPTHPHPRLQPCLLQRQQPEEGGRGLCGTFPGVL